MRKLTVVAFLLAASPIYATAATGSIIDSCWKGHDHAGMSACVASRAATALAELVATQDAIREAIRKGRDEAGFPDFRRDAISHLESADETYKRYRSDQCAYQALLASKGNGADDIRTACEAMLDSDRTVQLKASQSWL
jgi:hypothetical protein